MKLLPVNLLRFYNNLPAIAITVIVLVLLVGCSKTMKPIKTTDAFNSEKKLQEIIIEHEIFYLQASPFNKIEVAGNNAKLPDLSARTLLKNHLKRLTIYQELMTLPSNDLSQQSQINLAVLTYSLKNQA